MLTIIGIGKQRKMKNEKFLEELNRNFMAWINFPQIFADFTKKKKEKTIDDGQWTMEKHWTFFFHRPLSIVHCLKNSPVPIIVSIY